MPAPLVPPDSTRVLCTRWRRTLALGLAAGLAVWAPAQVITMPAGPKNQVESGTPSFVVINPESMGLSAPPTEIRRLPDGRILVVAQRQLAFGDGVRWETSSLATDISGGGTRSVLVAPDGQLYAGNDGQFTRIIFREDSHWQYAEAAPPSRPGGSLPTTANTACQAGGSWYWHSSSGAVTEWEPGSEPRVIGTTNAADSIFECNGSVYVSDRADGTLYRVDNGAMVPVFPSGECTPSQAISSAAPFDGTRSLVGTHALAACRTSSAGC